MKRIPVFALTAVLLCISQFASAAGDLAWGFGIRQHSEQPDFPEISFGEGDLSYGLSIQANDAKGYWQACLLYTPDIDGVDDLDYALTPQLNLIMIEGPWRLGVGGARTYVKTEAESGWNDFHWQLIGGIGLPAMGTLSLDVHAIYVFDEWGNVGEFDSDNLEYAIWVGIPF